jgi:N-[(2S)-2-amino-2-carboxyethyl]-L-glutamate dehydrogenase
MVDEFQVIPGKAIAEILAGSRPQVVEVVRDTYRLHHERSTINPDSYFLRFPHKPTSRVIALPSYLGGEVDRIGIKWISSFPGNHAAGLPRASAVLILNDAATGYPLACLEGAQISAARTAASAALAVATLGYADEPRPLAFVGAGVISRAILDYLQAISCPISEVTCFDVETSRARAFLEHAAAVTGGPTRPASSLAEALESSVVVFATTALAPYVPADTVLRPGQLLLNISLRDLAPELLLGSVNVLDDVDHCLKASTSPHLAEQLSGSRDFIAGTLGGLLAGEVQVDRSRPVIFSPFGLGVLDLGLGAFVLEQARRAGTAQPVPGFFDGASQ